MAESSDETRILEFREPNGMRIESRIWAGKRSQWYSARQIRLERTVALKYLQPGLAGSLTFREAFFEAGRQASVIVHPAAIAIINVHREENCIVMQWANGKSLRDLGATLDPLRVASIGEMVMDCLSSLHATGRCHGNLSPGNVFLSSDGVAVDDFFQPPIMIDGERKFTSNEEFIAPETLSFGASGWISDVFSLGQILSQVLAPEHGGSELAQCLVGLRSEDPRRRGGSPQSVLELFRRLRRDEEARLGMDAAAGHRAKRMYRRVPAEFAVAMRRRSATPGETAAILMKIRDIGESGVFVETDDGLVGIGSILELDFSLKGVEGNIHAFGVVRWKSTPPMAKGVGVQFVEVDQAGLAKLREFLGSR